MANTTNTEGIITAATTKTAAVKKKQPQTIKDYVKLYEGEIARALPSVMTPERFSRMVTTAITQTPLLSECTPVSFIGSMLTAAQLGLEPNTPLGHAYLIPFKKDRGKPTEKILCQFQIGYKGLIDLAHRSGEVKSIEARTVYENDKFVYRLGLNPALEHEPAMKDKGRAIWYYAIVHFNNGGYAFEVMSRQDVEAHARRFSMAFNNGPWKTDFDEMAKKTVLKKALKYAPLKSDFARGVYSDERTATVEFAAEEVNIVTEDVIEVNDAGEVVENE